MKPLFGPAGNGDDFAAAGLKHTHQAPAWLRSLGLSAYEYQCGRGVRLSEDTAAAIALAAAQNDIAVSVHAPYFISLASAEEEKRDNSLRYILDSAAAVSMLGGDRIVVHPGGLGGRSREEATALASETLTRAQRVLDEVGLSAVHICPETMGKINQLGDLDEVLTFCSVDERFLPCVDFGHLNCRVQGALNSTEAITAVLDRVADRLGAERMRRMHIHFSKIEYTAGGEKRHLTFEDTLFGPDPRFLIEALVARDATPVVICESSGTQARDAAALHDLWKELHQ
jgi:deoxyribonuclease-4